LLLPREDWEGRDTQEFGRTGMEGDFHFQLPGQPARANRDYPRAEDQPGAAVVTIGAELTLTDSDANNLVRSGSGSLTPNPRAARARARAGGRGSASASGVSTWSYFVPRRRRGVITAVMQRLELKPASPGPSLGARGGSGSGSEPRSNRRNGLLVGITNAAGDGPPSRMLAGAGAGAGGAGFFASPESFRRVDCGERGEVFTEDSRLLETITWTYEGELPNAGAISVGADGGALAEVRVLGAYGAGEGGGDVTVAKGVVPWPSSMTASTSGRQHVSVNLVAPGGAEVGSCRVCLALTAAASTSTSTSTTIAAADGGDQLEEEEEEEEEEEGEEEEDDVGAMEGGGDGAEVGVGATAVKTTRMRAQGAAVEGTRPAAGGGAPRSYRMSINLASVKGLDNAAYVVACYHYPFFGTSAPVRTSLVWAAPRMDTPLPNSCCTFSFGMSFDRLAGTTRDKKLVVSLRSKDRFKEEEIGLVTIPLEDVVESRPQYFRCRDTAKTFTSLSGFKSHLKSRRRSGDMSAEDALRTTPVEVRLLDRYLTVTSVPGKNNLNNQGAPTSALPSAWPPGEGKDEGKGEAGEASRVCSLRVILVLEDMGLTGDPDDKDNDKDNDKGNEETPFSTPLLQSATSGLAGTIPSASPPPAVGFGEEGQAVGAELTRAATAAAVAAAASARAEAEVKLERSRVEYERWRFAEEASFAKRLREKDQALEEKWESREAARRRELKNAQTDYSKVKE
ncbi:unnamed protein product, partial [Hapterophycus canaliculatus]